VLDLIVDLKIGRLRCFSRIRFKDSPKPVMHGKFTYKLRKSVVLFLLFVLNHPFG